MPFCESATLKFPKPKPGYPLELRSIGDHLLGRQLDLGLNRKEAAAQIGVDSETLKNWHQDRTEPEVRSYPALIRFLGYNPLPEANTQGQAVRRERMTRGLSRDVLALKARVDEATIRRIESDTPHLGRRSTEAVLGVLELL